MQPRVLIGRLYVTEAAAAAVPASEIDAAVWKHICGDWGDVDEDHARENEESLSDYGGPLASHYRTEHGWLILWTERDRSQTIVVFAPFD